MKTAKYYLFVLLPALAFFIYALKLGDGSGIEGIVNMLVLLLLIFGGLLVGVFQRLSNQKINRDKVDNFDQPLIRFRDTVLLLVGASFLAWLSIKLLGEVKTLVWPLIIGLTVMATVRFYALMSNLTSKPLPFVNYDAQMNLIKIVTKTILLTFAFLLVLPILLL